ncbi:MAG: hypothetical protein N2691_05875 [Patescibacteria group bacterium]|nr:hypothetical protein [Patescibacteria group bacterium]
MKIFFSASLLGDFPQEIIRKIYHEIEALGFEHTDNEAVTLSKEEFIRLKELPHEDRIRRYNEKMDAIKKADICVFDASAHSLSTGFLVHASLDHMKPTIVLYYKDLVPYFMAGIENERLIIRGYDEKTLKKMIREVITLAREKRDKRFNFFISPKLLEFLERASAEEGITKSKYIRNLIVEHMRSNKNSKNTE